VNLGVFNRHQRMERSLLVRIACVNSSLPQPLAGGWGLPSRRVNVPIAGPGTDRYLPPRGHEGYMTSTNVSPPSMEQSPLDAGVLRAGILALIALIVGSMFTYDLIRSSPRTPLPTQRPSALGAAPVLVANPIAQMPSN